MNSDERKSPGSWDAALGKAFRNLPEHQAPPTLLPRVMAQVIARDAQRSLQRSKRSWWAWVSTSVLLLAAAAWLSWLGDRFYDSSISPIWDRCVGICQTVIGAMVQSLVLRRFHFGAEAYHFIPIGISLLLLAMYVTCVGVGSFVYRTVRR